jgi:hypothetical protein
MKPWIARIANWDENSKKKSSPFQQLRRKDLMLGPAQVEASKQSIWDVINAYIARWSADHTSLINILFFTHTFPLRVGRRFEIRRDFEYSVYNFSFHRPHFPAWDYLLQFEYLSNRTAWESQSLHVFITDLRLHIGEISLKSVTLIEQDLSSLSCTVFLELWNYFTQ